jgi:hypothetical protein
VRIALVIILFLISDLVFAQTCPNRIQLQPVAQESRNQTIIYKSNWNVTENREDTIEEGNHSQKGAALLVYYKATKYLPKGKSIEIRTPDCKLIAKMGRFPRCTQAGCGNYERWYLRAPGGSWITLRSLEARAGGRSILVRLAGRQWAVVQNIFDDREVK